MKNLNVSNPSQSPIVKQQKIDTCLTNHGVEYGYMIDRHIVYKSISKLNERMFQILDDNSIEYEREFRKIQARNITSL